MVIIWGNEIPVLGNLVTAKSHYCETIETVKSQQWGKMRKQNHSFGNYLVQGNSTTRSNWGHKISLLRIF